MKKTFMKRILHKRLQGGITTYVFIMFGTALILYMFGFTNMFGATTSEGYRETAYSNQTSQTGNISNPDFQVQTNPVEMAVTAILSFAGQNMAWVIGGIGGVIGLLFLSRVVGGEIISTYLAYLIPIGILAVFLNYFIYPISSLDESLRHMELAPGLEISIALIIFFNLFFLLSVFDFITGRQT